MTKGPAILTALAALNWPGCVSVGGKAAALSIRPAIAWRPDVVSVKESTVKLAPDRRSLTEPSTSCSRSIAGKSLLSRSPTFYCETSQSRTVQLCRTDRAAFTIVLVSSIYAFARILSS